MGEASTRRGPRDNGVRGTVRHIAGAIASSTAAVLSCAQPAEQNADRSGLPYRGLEGAGCGIDLVSAPKAALTSLPSDRVVAAMRPNL